MRCIVGTAAGLVDRTAGDEARVAWRCAGCRTSRMRKKAKNRLLARAAQKGVHVFAGTHRAATGRERSSGGLFPHPVTVAAFV
jgi:hypothetical protein